MDKKIKVLIVDESKHDSNRLVTALEQGGYTITHKQVCTKSDFTQAVNDVEWDIILTEDKPCDLSCLDALSILQSNELDTPLIIVSGTIHEEQAIEAMNRGATDYVMKDNLIRLVPAVTREIRDARIRLNRRRVMNDLKTSEKRFKKLIENAPDGVVLISHEGKFMYVSPSASKIFGYDTEESLKFDPNELTHPEDLPNVLTTLDALIKNPAHKPMIQYRFRHKSGSWIWIESTFSNLLNEPDVGAIVINFRDITERRELEDRLKFHSYLLDEIGEAVMATTIDGTVIYWNNAAEKLFGWTSDEVLGRSVIEVIPSQMSRSQATAIMESLRKGKSWSGEFQVQRKDGTTFPAMVTDTPLFDEAGKVTGIVGISSDVSERKKAEERIQFQASLLDQVNNGILATDIDGKITLWNKFAEKLHGWKKEEVLGKLITDFLIDERSLIDADEYREEFEKKGNWSGELVLLRKDNSSFPAYVTHSVIHDTAGNRIGTVAVSVDITEQKQIEEVLLQSQQQLQLQAAALESTANAIVITDKKGFIEWANPAFYSLTGYSSNEAEGLNTNTLKSGKMSDEFYSELWNTILSGEVWSGELINKRKDGTLYNEKMTITPVKDSNGNITHFVAVKEDISKQIELQHRLIQTQKLEGIGTLASGIAHDFNNILGIILGYCTLLERSRKDDERFKENLKTITQAVHRGANLVNQILAFARKSDVEDDIVDLNKSIRELYQMLDQTFPKSISIELKLDVNLPVVVIDQTHVNQALLNLCINARDAILAKEKPYGTITIHTTYIAGKKLQDKFPDAIPDKYIVLSVSDTGTGIDESIRDRIFEPFYTTKGPDKGTGLGLSLVYGVVKTYNGFIDLDSEVGRGSTFTLYIPVYRESTAQKTDERSAEVEAPRGTETLLVVEDEELLRNAIVEILENHGYRTIPARDGEEGVKKYKENKDEIVLVIMDMGLPRMSGIELFTALRKINPEIKSILASGFIEPGLSSELFKKGLKEIIRKPFDAEEILQKVRNIIDM